MESEDPSTEIHHILKEFSKEVLKSLPLQQPSESQARKNSPLPSH